MRDSLKSNLLLFLLPLPLFFALAAGPILTALHTDDFGFFYSAAHMVLDGRGHQLYDFHSQQLYQLAGNHNTSLFFYYPAAAVVPVLPFAVFPFKVALLVWDFVSLLAVAICGALLTEGRPTARRMAGVFSIYFFGPTLYLLVAGQMTAVILIAIAGAWLNWKRPLRSGLWLSLGLLKFQLIAGFIVLLALRRQWRALAGVCSGAFVLYLVGAVIAGWLWPMEEMRLSAVGERLGAWPPIMPNLRGLIACATGHSSTALVVSLSLAVLVLAWRFKGRTEQVFPTALVASLLMSWHMNPHDLILLLVPLWISRWPAAIFSAAGAVLMAASLLVNPHIYGWMGLVMLGFFVLTIVPLQPINQQARVPGYPGE